MSMLRTDGTDGGPAFPVTAGQQVYATGMSLRDWFAGQALATAYAQHEGSPDRTAEWAYQVADAMLKARDAT